MFRPVWKIPNRARVRDNHAPQRARTGSGASND